jgi:hypothetical protein
METGTKADGWSGFLLSRIGGVDMLPLNFVTGGVYQAKRISMMDTTERQAHWENVYTTKAENEVSWFQDKPTHSLEFIHASSVGKDAAIIDVGGGESRLVDALLDEGYSQISVLDLSERAIATTKVRLGNARRG